MTLGKSEAAQSEFDTELFCVELTVKVDEPMRVHVERIPARRVADAFVTARGVVVRTDSLMVADCSITHGDVVVCVYTLAEVDVEGAVTVAWTAARNETAGALEDANARFRSAHGRPVIVHSAWLDGGTTEQPDPKPY